MSPRAKRRRATRKLVEWHQLRLAIQITAPLYRRVYRQIRKLRATLDQRMGRPTRVSPVGQTFDVCGQKVFVRERRGDVLICDFLPPYQTESTKFGQRIFYELGFHDKNGSALSHHRDVQGYSFERLTEEVERLTKDGHIVCHRPVKKLAR